jgi:chromosome segregation ATPase
MDEKKLNQRIERVRALLKGKLKDAEIMSGMRERDRLKAKISLMEEKILGYEGRKMEISGELEGLEKEIFALLDKGDDPRAATNKRRALQAEETDLLGWIGELNGGTLPAAKQEMQKVEEKLRDLLSQRVVSEVFNGLTAEADELAAELGCLIKAWSEGLGRFGREIGIAPSWRPPVRLTNFDVRREIERALF